MTLTTKHGRCDAVAQLGEAPQLASYLASLKAQEVAVVVEEVLDDRSLALVRQLRRAIVILGEGISSSTKTVCLQHSNRHTASHESGKCG